MNLVEEIELRTQMLSEAVENILNSKDDSHAFYLDIICKLGIYDNDRLIYGPSNQYINPFSGLWQEPFQFAMLLSFLAKQNLKSYCEIGPFQYWSFALISAVLNKYNDSKSFAVDNRNPITHYVHDVLEKYNIKYDCIIGTSENIKNNKYDLVFIDADHSYNGVKSDWENVGQFSKITLFHDINDQYVEKEENDGPKIFFDSLSKNKMTITTDHKVMGIGIVFNDYGNSL